MQYLYIFCVAILFAAAPTQARAADDVSVHVKSMLTTAAGNNDRDTFNAILQTALVTWPKNRVQIIEMASVLRTEWLAADELQEVEVAKAAAHAAEKKSRERGIVYYLDPALWNGQAELGAGQSSGDTDEQSLYGGLSFKRDFGTDWSHEIDLSVDYARREGLTTKRRLIGDYQARWTPWDQLFAVNFLRIEIDRFSGYDYRITENLGLGYEVFNNDQHRLSFEAGPGVRISKLDEASAGISDLSLRQTEIVGRISTDYELRLTDTITVRDRSSIFLGQGSTTIDNKAELSAKINSHLVARLAFEVRYESDAPDNTAATDTITRATLVYDF